ncbi:MAG: hypothetical protein KAQ73_02810 [Dehalococcoidia bacterium]|nr:hypothetical protein [Dehalococcoidia bacterium]
MIEDTEGLSINLKRSNSRYRSIDDLASVGAILYHLVIYGGEKFGGKNVNNNWEFDIIEAWQSDY